MGYDVDLYQDGYVNIIENRGIFEGENSAQLAIIPYLAPISTPIYRNFLMGWYHIEVPGTIIQDFNLTLRNDTPWQVIYGGGAYTKLVARTFHTAVRSCATN